MDRSINALLVGLGATTLSALESLSTALNVIGIIRDVDASAGGSDPVALRASALKVPLFRDSSPSSIEQLVLQMKPDCVVVSSYNRIFRPEVLALCPFVNVHYSPLPRYRGRANVNWAMINDEPFTAITIHVITPELDGGNILFQRLLPITHDDTVDALYRRLNEIQKENLAETVIRFMNGYQGVPQDEELASYGCSRTPEDGQIDWSESTRWIDCLIRALVDPFPGAYTYLHGRRLTIWKAAPAMNPPDYLGRVPGRVVSVSMSGGYADVLTGDGVLRIFEVQLQDEDRTPAASVIKSVRTTLGLRVPELLARVQQLEQQVEMLTQGRDTMKRGQ
jgi:methionyl-tRNA formyltransferase